jgi:hypothetical protein
MNKDVLATWLLVHGFAEEVRGYGHVSADELAEALLEWFNVSPRNDGAAS